MRQYNCDEIFTKKQFNKSTSIYIETKEMQLKSEVH